MSTARPQKPGEGDAALRDWFLPAIECQGTVSESLAAVLGELDRRAAFKSALKANLELENARGLDSVSELAQATRALENTLRFRLGILRPERPAAWFRAPAATSTGPFAKALLEEPVFAPYDPEDAETVRARLDAAWAERSAERLPFKDRSGCLWVTLLGLAARLERVTVLGGPFPGLRLDQLPDGLPPELESRPLRAFLLNVRGEVLATLDRLAACHRQLRETSDKLWCAQIEETRRQRAEGPEPRPGTFGAFARGRTHVAGDLREEFKRRRAAAPLRPFLTPAEMDALRFMGFEDMPTADALRQRYLAMAKRLHPDRQNGDDQAFKILATAYAQLTDRVGG